MLHFRVSHEEEGVTTMTRTATWLKVLLYLAVVPLELLVVLWLVQLGLRLYRWRAL